MLLSCLFPPGGTLRAEIRTLSFNNGTLTLNVRDEEAGKVISKVSSIVGFDAHISPPSLGKKTVSLSFKNLPVERALLRLISALGVKNYSLSFGGEGEIEEVKIIGGAGGKDIGKGSDKVKREKPERSQMGDNPVDKNNNGIDLIDDEPEESVETSTPPIPLPVPAYRYKPVAK